MGVRGASLLAVLAFAAAGVPEPFPIPGKGAVAYRNGCASNCPLLIMLHGAGGDGQKMAENSQMHHKFTGLIAYPSALPFATGWPIVPETPYWDSNLDTVNALIALPDVDRANVFVAGFSSGGFYTYALACALGDQLAAVVVLAGLKYIQPTCPYHTNVLHFHNLHDTYNVPVDPPNGTKPGGLVEIGAPATLRRNWLDATRYPAATTNGPSGVKQGYFTHYAAVQGGRGEVNITYDYYSYYGSPEHAYHVYQGVPDGAPDHQAMEDYITTYLTAHQ